MLVVRVLVVTAAAMRKVRTTRFGSFGGGPHNEFGAGAGESGLRFVENRVNFFARQDKRDKNGFAAAMLIGGQASQAITAVDHFFNS